MEQIEAYSDPVHQMPRQKPGYSKQDYRTPRNFLDAVETRFGKIAWDLAADSENTAAPAYITREQNSLSVDWSVLRGLSWLNPPFGKIVNWVKKASETHSGDRILVLVPASVGANWFRDYVDGKARVYMLNGRLTFVDMKQCFPKDLVLLSYGFGVMPGYEVWNWRK